MAKVDLERVNEAMDSFLKKAEAVNLRRRDIVENLPQLLSAIRMFERLEELMSGVEENSQRFKVYLDLAQSIASKGENYKVAKGLTEREAYLADKVPKGSDRLSYDEVSELLKLIRSSKLEKFVEFIDAESPGDFQRFRELVVEEASESASKAVKAALEEYRNSGQGLGSVSRKSSTISDFLTNRVTGYQDFVGDSNIGTAYLPSKGRGLGSKEEYRQAETREEEKSEAVISASDAIKDFIYNYTPPKDEKNIEVKIEKGSKEEEDSESSLWSTLKTVGLIAGVISAGSFLINKFGKILDDISSLREVIDEMEEAKEEYSAEFSNRATNSFLESEGVNVQSAAGVASREFKGRDIRQDPRVLLEEFEPDLVLAYNSLPEGERSKYGGVTQWFLGNPNNIVTQTINKAKESLGLPVKEYTPEMLGAARTLMSGSGVLGTTPIRSGFGNWWRATVGNITGYNILGDKYYDAATTIVPKDPKDMTPEELAGVAYSMSQQRANALVTAYFAGGQDFWENYYPGVTYEGLKGLEGVEAVRYALGTEKAKKIAQRLNRNAWVYTDRDVSITDSEFQASRKFTAPIELVGELAAKYGDPRGSGDLDRIRYAQETGDLSVLNSIFSKAPANLSPQEKEEFIDQVVNRRSDFLNEDEYREYYNYKEASERSSVPIIYNTSVVSTTNATPAQIPGDL